jgi:acetylornithine deacetylase
MAATATELRILAQVERRFDEMVDLTARLVRINTVNPYSGDDSAGTEKPGQELMRKELKAAGALVEIIPVPVDIYRQCGVLGPQGRSWEGRYDVIGRFRFPARVQGRPGTKRPKGSAALAARRPGKTLILNCHMDTVGTAGYEGDPFEGVVREGKLWGRGSSDSKGNLVIGLTAIKALLGAEVDLGGEILFESVVDEECNGTGAGTLACLKAGLVGDGCFALDGGADCPYRGCDGVVTPEIEVAGRSGHSAFGAVNAIEKLMAVKSALDQFRERRRTMTPPRPVNIGLIRGGTLPAIVPQKALMQYNINYGLEEVKPSLPFPGAAVMQQLEAVVSEAARADSWLREHPPRITWLKDAPPYRLPDDLPIVRLVEGAYAEVLGRVPPGGVAAWGDAAHFWNLAHIPVIGMGGTTISAAHSSCEYAEPEGMLTSAKALALAAYRFLAA